MEINIKIHENDFSRIKHLRFKVASLTQFEETFASFLIEKKLIGAPFQNLQQDGLDLFFVADLGSSGKNINEISTLVNLVKSQFDEWYSKLSSLMVIHTVSLFKESEVANEN